MEAVIAVDVLRRAGVSVSALGVAGVEPVECSRGVRLLPDAALADRWPPPPGQSVALPDAVVLPGGAGGAAALAGSAAVGELLRAQCERGGLVAAVCAAPTALAAHGIGRGFPATSHPSVSAQLAGYFDMSEARVVVSAPSGAPPLITSRGPGTSFQFALAIVEHLCGAEAARAVAAPMLL